MSKKNEVSIQWKTHDKWHNCRQRVKRKNIKLLDGPLKKGQRISILFNRRWSDGEVCEAWPKENQSLGGNFLREDINCIGCST